MTRAAPSASREVGRSMPAISDRDVCPRCRYQQCVSVCPTSCYARRDDGRIDLDLTRCVSCRACVSICFEFTNIAWGQTMMMAGD